MPQDRNNHGLSRYIPAEIERQVRTNSKNGCVICRALVCDYEHIDPPFANAEEHSSDVICLLCASCHAEKTRGRLNAAQILAACYNVRNRDVGVPHHQAHFSGSTRLSLGNSVFDHMPNGAAVLRYDGQPILLLSYLEDQIFGGFRPSITGAIHGPEGSILVAINDNLLTFVSTGMVVTEVGKKFQCRQHDGTIVLDLEFAPPNGFTINRLNMKFRDLLIDLNNNFGVEAPCGLGTRIRFSSPEIEASGASVAIDYNSDPAFWKGSPLVAIGDVGIVVPHSGITIAAGAGVMKAPRMGVGLVKV